MGKRDTRRFSLENVGYEVRKEESRRCLKQQRKETKLDEDKANRENVRKKLKNYLEGGRTIEEAADLIMQDEEIVTQFSYYTKRGIDLKQCFMNWAKGMKSKIGDIKTDGETR